MPNALIMMLYNSITLKFHPIWYKQLSTPTGLPENIIKFQSKAHHVEGFIFRKDALENCEELRKALESIGYFVVMETYDDILWDNEDQPLDFQIREIQPSSN